MESLNHLEQGTEKQFKSLLGKRVELIDGNGRKRVGVLEFAGVNPFLNKGFQVTISRCPIWNVERETIKLHETKRIFS